MYHVAYTMEDEKSTVCFLEKIWREDASRNLEISSQIVYTSTVLENDDYSSWKGCSELSWPVVTL